MTSLIQVENTTNWNQLIAANQDFGDPLQLIEFANIKKSGHWNPLFFQFQTAKSSTINFLVLEKKVPILGKIWYIPKGPGITDPSDLTKCLQELISFSKHKNIFLIKFEPKVTIDLNKAIKIKNDYLEVEGLQGNQNTVIINLKADYGSIESSFKQRARRSIKQDSNAKLYVKEVPVDQENIDTLYSLYQQTGQRGYFFVRSKSYYQKFWQDYSSSGHGQMFLVYNAENEAIAGAFIIWASKKMALYKDGASARLKSGPSGAYLLQSEIIKWLHQNNFEAYDMHGSPPSKSLLDPNHKLYSLGLFKTAFSQDILELANPRDIILNKTKYKIWNSFLGQLYKKLYKKIKKDLFY
jgi:lipid II:glycine glycyltransferase (peptidoglycan interpeptide bridge formation enzyme)